MKMQGVIGELLYIGFGAEKGRYAIKFSYQNMNEQERLRYSVYLEENND